MPNVIRIKGYRIFFSSLDFGEPPHVHVETDVGHAKFWLAPVSFVYSRGFRDHELSEIRRIVEANAALALEKWNEHFHH